MLGDAVVGLDVVRNGLTYTAVTLDVCDKASKNDAWSSALPNNGCAAAA